MEASSEDIEVKNVEKIRPTLTYKSVFQWFQNADLWTSVIAFVAIAYCCAMTSGQVWNKIKTPRLHGMHNGNPFYLNSQWKEQFKYESYAVAACNLASALGMIIVIEARNIRCKWLRRLMYLAGLQTLYYCLSLILWAVRNKRRYPYRLFFN